MIELILLIGGYCILKELFPDVKDKPENGTTKGTREVEDVSMNGVVDIGYDWVCTSTQYERETF